MWAFSQKAVAAVSAEPMGVLISWAMPATRLPSAAIFSAWTRVAWAVRSDSLTPLR